MIRYREPWTPASRFLSLAVRAQRDEGELKELASLYAEIGPEASFAAAGANKVLPIVALTMVREVEDVGKGGPWPQIVQANRARVSRLIASLREVFAELNRRGVPGAVIENGGVLLASGMPLETFAAGDFDLLVAADRLEDTRSAFQELGFREADRRQRTTNRLEYCRAGNGSEDIWINPGALPFDRMWVPLPYLDPSTRWLTRREGASPEATISVLSPSDALVLVAVHTSLHSFVRAPFVRLHADVDWLVRRCPIDWAGVISESRHVGLPTRVWLSLVMAQGILGTPVPEDVLAELAPAPPRASRLLHLLEQEGCFWTGRRKLPGARAVRLDALLSEDGIGGWLGRVAFPSKAWLKEHFDRNGTRRLSRFRLGMRRLGAAVHSWRPE